MGGIRVERARRWMKLILTADTRLAPIATARRPASLRGAYLGWQDDGVEMGIVGVGGRAVLSCEVLRPEDAAKAHSPASSEQRAASLPVHRITVAVDALHSTTAAAMSALPRSIGSRLLAPALRPSATRSLAPAYRTYATNEPTPYQHKTSPDDAPAVPLKSDSTQIRKESAAEGMRHAPDYNVAVDYRTSCVDLDRSQSRAG